MIEQIFASAAIVISLISLYITKLNRRNALREKIFGEQIDVAKKIQSSITKLEYLLEDISLTKDTQKKSELLLELDIEYEKFWELIDNSSLFFEDSINGIITEQISLFHEVYKKVKKGEKYAMADYSGIFFEIQDSLHIMLGIPKLSRENRRLIRERGD